MITALLMGMFGFGGKSVESLQIPELKTKPQVRLKSAQEENLPAPDSGNLLAVELLEFPELIHQ